MYRVVSKQRTQHRGIAVASYFLRLYMVLLTYEHLVFLFQLFRTYNLIQYLVHSIIVYSTMRDRRRGSYHVVPQLVAAVRCCYYRSIWRDRYLQVSCASCFLGSFSLLLRTSKHIKIMKYYDGRWFQEWIQCISSEYPRGCDVALCTV